MDPQYREPLWHALVCNALVAGCHVLMFMMSTTGLIVTAGTLAAIAWFCS